MFCSGGQASTENTCTSSVTSAQADSQPSSSNEKPRGSQGRLTNATVSFITEELETVSAVPEDCQNIVQATSSQPVVELSNTGHPASKGSYFTF